MVREKEGLREQVSCNRHCVPLLEEYSGGFSWILEEKSESDDDERGHDYVLLLNSRG